MPVFDSDLDHERFAAKLTRYLWNVPTTITRQHILDAMPSSGFFTIQIERQPRTPLNQARIMFNEPRQACKKSLIVNGQTFKLHNEPMGSPVNCPFKQQLETFSSELLAVEMQANAAEDEPAEMAAWLAVAAVKAAASASLAERSAAARVATGVPLEPPFICYLHGPGSAVRRMLIVLSAMTSIIDMQVESDGWPAAVKLKTRDDLIAFLAGGNAANSSVRLIPAKPK